MLLFPRMSAAKFQDKEVISKSCDMGRLLFPRRSAAKCQDNEVISKSCDMERLLFPRRSAAKCQDKEVMSKSCDMGRLLFPRRSAAKQQDKKVTKSHAIWEGCCFREGQLPSSRTKKSRKVMRYGKVVVSAKVSCQAAKQKVK